MRQIYETPVLLKNGRENDGQDMHVKGERNDFQKQSRKQIKILKNELRTLLSFDHFGLTCGYAFLILAKRF